MSLAFTRSEQLFGELSGRARLNIFSPTVVHQTDDPTDRYVIIGMFADGRDALIKTVRALPQDTPLEIYSLARNATHFKATSTHREELLHALEGKTFVIQPEYGGADGPAMIHAVVGTWYDNEPRFVIPVHAGQTRMFAGFREASYQLSELTNSNAIVNVTYIVERDGQWLSIKQATYKYRPGYVFVKE